MRFEGQFHIQIFIRIFVDALCVMQTDEFEKSDFVIPYLVLLIVYEKHRKSCQLEQLSDRVEVNQKERYGYDFFQSI